MLIDRSMFDLVHLVELHFEDMELFSFFMAFLYHMLFELLQSVYDLHEVGSAQEKVEILLISLLDDDINRQEEGVLLEVRLKLIGLELLHLVEVGTFLGDLCEVSWDIRPH